MNRILFKLNKTIKTVLIMLLVIFVPMLLAMGVILIGGRTFNVLNYCYDLSRSLKDMEAYETIANVCLHYAEENPSKSGLMWYVTYNDLLSTYIWEDGDASESIDVPLTEQEKDALTKVRSWFILHRGHLEDIFVKDKYVSFCPLQTPASIIYSPDDTRPDFLRYSGEEIEYRHSFNVVKITDHWYFACN